MNCDPWFTPEPADVSLGRAFAPFGLARVEVCGTVFPVGRYDALDPAVFDLRSNEDAAATKTLGVGAELLLGEPQIGQRSPLVIILRRTGLGRAGRVPGVDPHALTGDAVLLDQVLDHQVCHTVAFEQAGNGVRHRELSSMDREGIHSKHTPKGLSSPG